MAPGPDPFKVLKEGSSYRFTLIRTADQRLRLKVEELSPSPATASGVPSGSRPAAFYLASPPYEDRESIVAKGAAGEGARPLEPLPAGYRFAVYDITGEGVDRQARFGLKKIQVRTLAIPEGEPKSVGR